MLEPFGLVTSVTKFAPPRSRRTTNRWELLLPPPLPVRCDGCVPPEVTAPLPGTGEDPPPEGTGQSIHPVAEDHTVSTTGMAGLELTSTLSLWSQFVWQQIRPRLRSRRREEQGAGDPPEDRRRSALEAHSSRTGPAGLPHEEPVETLFTQLARRRLPSRATKETR
jgi:hypothetical protein